MVGIYIIPQPSPMATFSASLFGAEMELTILRISTESIYHLLLL